MYRAVYLSLCSWPYLQAVVAETLNLNLTYVKDEFLKLLGEWCEKKLGENIAELDHVVLRNPVRLFMGFQAYYLANPVEASVQLPNQFHKLPSYIIQNLRVMHVILVFEYSKISCMCAGDDGA